MAKNCEVPDCPVKPWEPPKMDPNCMCDKPIGISVRPGEHAHICPVHPEAVIYGDRVVW